MPKEYASAMIEVASAARAAFGALDLDQLARLVDQLPVLLWSTDQQLRVTSRRGGGLDLLGPVPTPQEGLRVGDGSVEAPAESARAVAAHRGCHGDGIRHHRPAPGGRRVAGKRSPPADDHRD